MGNIADMIKELKEKADFKNTDKKELLQACADGFVFYKCDRHYNSFIYNVYLKYKNIKKRIGFFEPKRVCGAFIFGDNLYINNILVDVLRMSGSDDIYISLDELIKHGAQEIKENE
jgi:hypothetical protein